MSSQNDVQTLSELLECLLFVSTEPVQIADLVKLLELEQPQIEEAMQLLTTRCTYGGLHVVQLAGGYQLCTKGCYSETIAKFLNPSQNRMTRAQLEVMAIIAYRQPVTIPEIEQVRGVQSDAVVRKLAQKRLIEECGKKNTPGRPILYITTRQFLHYFGLNELSQLPDIDQFHNIATPSEAADALIQEADVAE